MDKNFKAINEPIIDFEPGSEHRKLLLEEIERQSIRQKDIPIIINGKEIRTGNTKPCTKPQDHGHILGHYHEAGPEEIQMAIDSSLEAWKTWSNTSLEERAKIFKKVADLIAGPYRYKINAAAMLDIGKSVFQAEVDASCELIDFLNFNIEFAYTMQNSFTPISPDLAISKAIKDAKICTIIQIWNLFRSALESRCPKSVPLNKPWIAEILLGYASRQVIVVLNIAANAAGIMIHLAQFPIDLV